MNNTDHLDRALKLRAQTENLTRPEELKWYVDQFQIEEPRLLRLLGYTPASVKKLTGEGRSLIELAEAKPEQTIWVTELFRELADDVGYDLQKMKQFLTDPVADDSDRNPSRQNLLGVAAKKPHRKTVPMMLDNIQQGGPGVLRELAQYMQAPLEVTRKKKPQPHKPKRS